MTLPATAQASAWTTSQPVRAAPVRTLPIRVPPRDGESLISWLDRTAARLRVTRGQLLDAVGLPRAGTRRQARSLRALQLALQPGEAGALARATGTDPDRLKVMTLAAYHGRVLRLTGDRRAVRRDQLWARGAGTRACPACLAQAGHWQLAWRLTWAVACPTHHLLLVDRCPSCHTPLGSQRPGQRVIPDPTACQATRPGGVRCGQDLTDVPAPALSPDSPVLATHRWLDDLIHGPLPDRHVAATLRDLQTLAGWITSHATTDQLRQRSGLPLTGPDDTDQRRRGMFPPPHVDHVAAVLAWAVSILTHPADRAAHAARPLVSASRSGGQPTSPTALARQHGPVTPGLHALLLRAADTDLTAVDRLRYRTPSPTPQPLQTAAQISHRARSIPALLWADWARLLLPGRRPPSPAARAALAAALLLPGNPERRLAPARAILGQGHGLEPSHLLGDRPDRQRLLTALCLLADHLDAHPAPIDYQQRRALEYQDLLTAHDWQRACAEVGHHPGTRTRHQHARRHLYQRLTGNPATSAWSALGITERYDLAASCAFSRGLPADLSDGLDRIASAFLAAHGIDEPVTWQPSPNLIADLTGFPSTPVSLPVAADPPPAPPPAGRTPNWRTHQRLTLTLTAYTLADLLARGETLRQFARETGHSRQAITRQLHAVSLPTPPAGRQPAPIDPDWLSHRYLTDQATTRQIADELGSSPSTVLRHLHAHGIPVRPRGGARPMICTGPVRRA